MNHSPQVPSWSRSPSTAGAQSPACLTVASPVASVTRCHPAAPRPVPALRPSQETMPRPWPDPAPTPPLSLVHQLSLLLSCITESRWGGGFFSTTLPLTLPSSARVTQTMSWSLSTARSWRKITSTCCCDLLRHKCPSGVTAHTHSDLRAADSSE